MSDDASHRIPRNRLARLTRLARAGARTGISMLKKSDDGEGASSDAVKAAALLGQLRGVATKLGQMVSYVDGVIPPEHRDAYEKGMARLQAAAPASSPDEIRALFEAELGAPPETIYARWNDTPIASASIGQVHEAWLHDGRKVAVKVQHPGVAEALEADLKNARLMEMAFAMMGGRKFESKRMLAELRERFREELDYALEAERQRIFALIHSDEARIKIPAVIDHASSRRVLTSEFVEGIAFEEACNAPTEDRRLWAETLWRFVYRANLVGGLFNADPHPGNYRFQPDGSIAFVDFGCVQPIPTERRLTAAAMHQAVQDNDRQAFQDGARAMLGLDGGRYEELAFDYIDASFRPLTDSPFHLTRDYSANLIERFKAMTFELMKGSKDNYVPMPPGILFINRLQFGFYSVLARLDVEVDYRAVEARYIKEAFRSEPWPWERD